MLSAFIKYFKLYPHFNRDLLFSTLIAFLFSFESWLLGPLSWMYGYGSGLETIPALKALSFEDRNLSLWSPFVAGGLDRLAFWGNANPYGPEYFLFKFLPAWLANGMHRFLQYFVASYFAIKVAKEQLKLEESWAFLVALLFASFSFYTVGALFTLPGIPLILWLLDHSIHGTKKYFKCFLSALLISFTTTFTFGVPYILFFCFLWFLIIRRIKISHFFWPFLVFTCVLCIFTAPQLLAISINGSQSHRVGWDIESLSFSVDGLFYRQLQFDLFGQSNFLTLLTMNLPVLIFMVGMVLSFYSMKICGESKRVSINFFGVSAIFFLLSQKWAWISLQLILSNLLPFIKGVYMGRFFQIPAPFLIACGLTLSFRLAWLLWKKILLAKFLIVIFTVSLALVLLITPKIHLFYDLGVHDWGEKNYQIKALDELREIPDIFRVASVLPLQPAYAYAQGLETVDGWANLYPSVYRDLWLKMLTPTFNINPYNKKIFGVDTGKAEDNFIFLGSDLFSPGLGLLPNEKIEVALKEGFNVENRYNLNLLRLLNVRFLLSSYPLQGEGVKLYHDISNKPTWAENRSRNTGLVVGERQPPEMRLPQNISFFQPFWDYYQFNKKKLKGKDIYIYELENSLPRFRLVESIKLTSDKADTLNRLYSMSLEELRKSVIIQKSDTFTPKKSNNLSSGKVIVMKYSPDEIILATNAEYDSFLVIANTWNPYWIAEVDNYKTRLVRVNHAQFGLELSPGKHTIVLKYMPPYSFLKKPIDWLAR
ncbi:DUF6044 family protein [Polynucleobacter sp. IMCC 30228]|uniref:DUF6044 family protein n=1 Tax=Polynucleobacter sp. IMCC 30228 TaxID=2781011 RepID=UPI001F470EE1|nr:DUF6044 family protein [Polynucleobacter sp. IMCC 30228]MCE7527858.1 YfhO family protein [Polynucleobacter sp. IMCC 30228]